MGAFLFGRVWKGRNSLWLIKAWEVRKQEEVWQGRGQVPCSQAHPASEPPRAGHGWLWDAELESFLVCLFVCLFAPSRCYRYMKFRLKGWEWGTVYFYFLFSVCQNYSVVYPLLFALFVPSSVS